MPDAGEGQSIEERALQERGRFSPVPKPRRTTLFRLCGARVMLLHLHSLERLPATRSRRGPAAEMHCVSTSRYLPLRSSKTKPIINVHKNNKRVAQCLCSLSPSSNHPSNPSAVRWYPPLFEADYGLGVKYMQQMSKLLL